MFANMYIGVNWYLCIEHTCTCIGARDNCVLHATPTTTNAHTPAHARLCDRAATFLLCRRTRESILGDSNTPRVYAHRGNYLGCKHTKYNPHTPRVHAHRGLAHQIQLSHAPGARTPGDLSWVQAYQIQLWHTAAHMIQVHAHIITHHGITCHATNAPAACIHRDLFESTQTIFLVSNWLPVRKSRCVY